MLKLRMNSTRVLLVVASIACSFRAVSAPRPVIIDTDPGTDDAIAIVLALRSSELAVRALTVVPGNVTSAQGVDNARRIVSLAHRCDVPVAAGATRPLLAPLITGSEMWHGKNGLADVQLADPSCPLDSRWAPDLIIELVRAAPHQITLITIGPLTNIALALEKDPGIVPLVKEVVMMGGSISGGNATPAAEFNIYVDPEAAQLVFNAGWPLTMVGLDVCRVTLLTRARLHTLQGQHDPLAAFVYSIGDFLVHGAEQHGEPGSPMYDPLAVGVAIDPSLIVAAPMVIDVETIGGSTRGETVANRGRTKNLIEQRHSPEGTHYAFTGKTEPLVPNARVATSVHADRFLDLLLSRVRGSH
jgi:inosine-uridine nucleoside N-ribohydrolase